MVSRTESRMHRPARKKIVENFLRLTRLTPMETFPLVIYLLCRRNLVVRDALSSKICVGVIMADICRFYYLVRKRLPDGTAFNRLRLVALGIAESSSLRHDDHINAIIDKENNLIRNWEGSSILHILVQLKNTEMTKEVIISTRNYHLKHLLHLQNRRGKMAQDLARDGTEILRFLKWARRETDSGHYCLPHPPCSIIFYAKDSREGANKERAALTDGLRSLGMDPKIVRAESKAAIINALSDVRDRPFKTGLIVSVMCHGSNNGIKAENGEFLFYSNILAEMEKAIPTDKPKMLWIQACNLVTNRYSTRAESLSTSRDPTHDACEVPPDDGPQEIRLPGPNYHVILATQPGEIADRNNMIPKLGKLLKRLTCDVDIFRLFRRLTKEMEKDSSQRPRQIHNLSKYRICLKNIYTCR